MSVSRTQATDPPDELAQQRKKRAQRALERPIPGFGQMNMRNLLGHVMAGIEEHGGSFDVQQFLVERGHSTETIATVVGALHLADAVHPSCTVSPLGPR